MSTVVNALDQAARAFRIGMEAQGNETFIAFVDALQTELARPEHAATVAALAPFLSDVVSAQARGDFLRVADLLEHELRPHLIS